MSNPTLDDYLTGLKTGLQHTLDESKRSSPDWGWLDAEMNRRRWQTAANVHETYMSMRITMAWTKNPPSGESHKVRFTRDARSLDQPFGAGWVFIYHFGTTDPTEKGFHAYSGTVQVNWRDTAEELLRFVDENPMETPESFWRQPTKILSIKLDGDTIVATVTHGSSILWKSVEDTVQEKVREWATPANLGGRIIERWGFTGRISEESDMKIGLTTASYGFKIEKWKQDG